jgi:hypothetical protein
MSSTAIQQGSRKRKAEEQPNMQSKQQRVNESETSVSKMWLPRFNLTQNHRRRLNNKRRLDDSHINAFQQLIPQAIASQGWQDVAVGRISYEYSPPPSVQILHDGSGHWLVSAATSDGVIIADSLKTSPNAFTRQRLLELYIKPGDQQAQLDITYISVQKQQGVTQCGDFAIAFAAAFASRQSVQTISQLRFDQDNMRSHMIKCLTTATFSQFPTSKHHPSLFDTTLQQPNKYRIDKNNCARCT